MKTNPNEPIHQTVDADNKVTNYGITKLEYIATQALQGILSNSEMSSYHANIGSAEVCKNYTNIAVLYAKTLIESLNENDSQ